MAVAPIMIIDPWINIDVYVWRKRYGWLAGIVRGWVPGWLEGLAGAWGVFQPAQPSWGNS